jgi:cytochrome c peroxidase
VRSNGADARRRDTSVDGSELALNTNTVFNAALSFRFDWDGGVRTLEAQARRSIDSPQIMGGTIDEVVRALRADPVVVRQFNDVYGHGPDRESLVDAIATYERSLLTPGSRFDRWLGGDAAALSAQERDGYKQFKTLGCISCHQGVNVGGNLFERFGVFRSPERATSKPLRVPSLRNVAMTPPYFHDGAAPTLEDAVRRMGRAQLGLQLSDGQVAAVVSFLKTLTGTYRDRPVTRATR